MTPGPRGERRLYLDDAPGEARGVVLLDGRPERLIIERAADLPGHRPGARLAARVRRVDRTLATAFLDVGAAPDAVLPLTGEAARLSEGARIAVEVIGSPRQDKGAVVTLLGSTPAEPGLIAPAPALADRLQAWAPGAPIASGRPAREAADVAEAEALTIVHRLPSGGAIAIEPTRALVAVDVDVGGAKGDPRRAVLRTNQEALTALARLLRLKGLGGPVVIDLAGKGHDGEALKQAALAAFAPDQPGVALGAITRFGLWPLVLPRRWAPVAERLYRTDGTLSDESLALRLLRDIEGAAGPGERIEARAAPEVVSAASDLTPYLMQRIGARFRIVADGDAPRDAPIVRPWEDRHDR